MGRRGVLAEINHQMKVSAREAERRQRAAAKQRLAAARRAEQAQRASERAYKQAARSAAVEQKRLEKEAKAAHIEAMEATAEEQNAGLQETYDAIDNLLAATLEVDDYIDLNTFRKVTEHLVFEPDGLDEPAPAPDRLLEPSKPEFSQPKLPFVIFGRKRKHAEVMARAQAAHSEAVGKWKEQMAALPAQRQQQQNDYEAAEAERRAALAEKLKRYEAKCEKREKETAQYNEELDRLIANLGYGVPEAIQEYVTLVLSNSVYPEQFDVEVDFKFDSATSELQLYAGVPEPTALPDVKTYKYTKASDEITSTRLTQKICKDRYAAAVNQVALRSLHEVFEADRRGLILTVSVEVGTRTNDPATGNEKYVPFVFVAAAREQFLGFDLSDVVPAATLEHLGASVSKNPSGLVAVDGSGVRKS